MALQEQGLYSPTCTSGSVPGLAADLCEAISTDASEARRGLRIEASFCRFAPDKKPHWVTVILELEREKRKEKRKRCSKQAPGKQLRLAACRAREAADPQLELAPS